MEGDFETQTERQLAMIWAGVLKLDKVGREQDFFGLGGDSLLATNVVLEARRVWNIDITVRVLIDTPVLADLAERIDRWANQGPRRTRPTIRHENARTPVERHTRVGERQHILATRPQRRDAAQAALCRRRRAHLPEWTSLPSRL